MLTITLWNRKEKINVHVCGFYHHTFPYHNILSEFLAFSHAFITPQVATVKMRVYVHVQATKNVKGVREKTLGGKIGVNKIKIEGNFSESSNLQIK